MTTTLALTRQPNSHAFRWVLLNSGYSRAQLTWMPACVSFGLLILSFLIRGRAERDRPVLRMSSIEIWTGRIACVCLFVIAIGHMVALIFDPRTAVQVGLMLGISSASVMFTFKVVYTVSLLASSVGYFFGRGVIAFWGAIVIAIQTTLALVTSALDLAPLAPFVSVRDKLGEILTAVAAVLMILALSRRVFCVPSVHSQTKSGTNNAT